ncbi:MAG: glycoside hydrolase family 20 zincin-like fold domain-containing protein [Puia sp.]|nr:glycoside hydrolase family 20 zincin-like fold domain-containing protein [Puia sp.]
MKICCYLAILSFFFLSVQAQQHPTLLPAPCQIQYGRGSLPLSKLSLSIPSGLPADVSFALRELERLIRSRTDIPVRTTVSGNDATFQYTVSKKGMELPDATMTDAGNANTRETYRIDIDGRKIRVAAATGAGLYYAVQTLGQLIEGTGREASLPAVHIVDSPALAYRGVMMDFAHGSLLTVAEIKRQIDFLATWKANQYYFYNEVSITLDGYPTLNDGAAYSKDEIRSIIAYARERHMDLIPFVAFYGHLHELIRNEQYASLAIGKYGHELDPRNAAVDTLLKNWIGQYTRLFNSPFIHVGFDETWETNRIAHDVDSSIHSEDLWLRQLNFVQQELKKHGKTVLAWTDMNSFYPDILSKFPKEVIPVIWEYAPDTAALYHYLNPVLKENRSFFIQPAVSGWGHVYPASDYTYDNIDICLQAGMEHRTLGFITSVWTDAVEPFIRPSWPFMAYGCIGAWQGYSPERASFPGNYTAIAYPAVAGEMQQALSCLAKAGDFLGRCLGKNTGNMPGGTLVESWLNPFSSYYLKIAKEHIQDLRSVRRLSEEAEGHLIEARAKLSASPLTGFGPVGRTDDSALINSLLVSARLINYSATRLVWARTICERWNESMLGKKKNDFVFYDISYTCHGLLVDLMNETGELKEAYGKAWLTESKPYRLNTILGRFDVEYGLWQKLALKIQTYRIEHEKDEVATRSFEETFKPDF